MRQSMLPRAVPRSALRPGLLAALLGGCAPLAPPSPAGEKFLVFSDGWSAAIDTPASLSIRAAGDLAARAPADPVTVTGFADPQGSAAANVELSRSRAEAARDRLIQDGVAPAWIRQAAAAPVADAFSSQQSRRVDIAIDLP
jgi:hypothetical protein